MKNRRFLYILLPIIFLSCGKGILYEEFRTIPGAKWDKGEEKLFEAHVEDTSGIYNIYVSVRNSGEYRYRNLFLFVNTASPAGQVVRDTVEILLANEKGKWMGKGFGGIWETEKIYKRQVQFPVKGVYVFSVQHGMRTDTLHHILDAGIRIVKVKI